MPSPSLGKLLPSIATLELSNHQVTLNQDLSGILLNGKISEYSSP